MRPKRSMAAAAACLGAVGIGHVEGGDEQVLVLADGRAHGVGVAAGGHDVVAGSQGRAGELDAHAATGAGDEPSLRHGLHGRSAPWPGRGCCEPPSAPPLGRLADATELGSEAWIAGVSIREFLMSRRARVTPEQAGLLRARRRCPTGAGAASRGGGGSRRRERGLLHPARARRRRRSIRQRARTPSRAHCASTMPNACTSSTSPAPRRQPASRRPTARSARACSGPSTRSPAAWRSCATDAGTTSRPTRWPARCTRRSSTAGPGRPTTFDTCSSTTAPGTSSTTGRPWRTTRLASCAPKRDETRTTPDPQSSSRSSRRPAPSSGPSGRSTTYASQRQACTDSTTPSWATSTSPSRPRRCEQTPA